MILKKIKIVNFCSGTKWCYINVMQEVLTACIWNFSAIFHAQRCLQTNLQTEEYSWHLLYNPVLFLRAENTGNRENVRNPAFFLSIWFPPSFYGKLPEFINWKLSRFSRWQPLVFDIQILG